MAEHRGLGEPGQKTLSSGRRHRLRALGCCQQRRQYPRQGVRVFRGEQRAVNTVLDQFARPLDRTRHHRAGCRPGFEDDIAERLAARRTNQYVGCGEQRRDILPPAGEHHPLADAERTGEPHQRRPLRPVTGQHQPHAGQRRQGAKQDIEAFFGMQPAEPEQQLPGPRECRRHTAGLVGDEIRQVMRPRSGPAARPHPGDEAPGIADQMIAMAKMGEVVEAPEPPEQNVIATRGVEARAAHPAHHDARGEAAEMAGETRFRPKIDDVAEAEFDWREPASGQARGARRIALDDREHVIAGGKLGEAKPLEKQLRPAHRGAGDDMSDAQIRGAHAAASPRPVASTAPPARFEVTNKFRMIGASPSTFWRSSRKPGISRREAAAETGMCGIAGVMMRDGRGPDPAVLDGLAAALGHRGPDGGGRHVAGAVALVHRRLAIIDLVTGDQPLFGPGGLALVVNGEIYNDPALRAALPAARFQTHSDCEPILFLYAAHGLDFAARLRGMYALALHDPGSGRLILARDPFGIKPLYYVENAAGFAFASEPQALLRAGLARAEIDPARRAELLQLKFTTGAATIFPEIRRVLPGETLVVDNGRIVERRHLARLPPRPVTLPAALADLDRVLTESVALHLRSDVPYGLFLSGGIDSSALLWLMHRISGERVQAITIGYDGAEADDESETALAVARAVGARCERILMTEADFWAAAPRIAACLDDPTTDAAALPTWFLGRAAAGQLKVTLCGEGGDEMFAGYGRYRRAVAPWRFFQRPSRQRGVFDGTPGFALSGWREGFAAAERREAEGRNPLQALQALDCAEWLPNDLLIKLDRCLMAHGVEGRTPFVDPEIAAFAFALPDRDKVSWRLGKLMLRRWLAERLPAARPFARKRGFKPPVSRWIAARGARLAPLVAASPGIAAFASREAVAAVFAKGDGQATWSLLFYALWHAHHILGVAAGGDVEAVLAAAPRAG